MRWRSILDALAALDVQMTRAAITAITAISTFFGEGMWAWLLARLRLAPDTDEHPD
jgi:hypothetical protein